MSVSSKLEADSARLRVLEDAINEMLAYIRGRLAGLQMAEAALVAASADTLPKGQDAQQGLAGTESGAVPHVDEADAQTQSRNLSSNNSRKV